MMIQEYVTQPAGEIDYLQLFRIALRVAAFDRFNAAVAYATLSGVTEIQRVLNGDDLPTWSRMRKRWLVGIDWCRTDPLALDALSVFPNSRVRIPDGNVLVQRTNCTPLLPYHPKVYVLRGDQSLAIIAGSGNLSRNGLTRGHECGSVLVLAEPLAVHERQVWNNVQNVITWFDAIWRQASELGSIRAQYTARYDSVDNLQNPTPTDEDWALDVAPRRRREMAPEQLRQLRSSRHLWIEAGNMHNRGNQPGDQLQFSPMTKVFFGFLPLEVDLRHKFPDVQVRYDHGDPHACTFRYNTNGMEVLTLPVPGTGGWPASYDGETLMFERLSDHTFRMTVGGRQEIQQWRARSSAIGASFQMRRGRGQPRGRFWGVF